MPTLETADGRPVDVTPADPATVNATFNQVMNDDGPDTGAPPDRADKPVADAPRRGPGRPRKDKGPGAARTVNTGAAAASPALSLTDAQRSQGVQGFAQIAGGLALMTGRATNNAAFFADAVTVSKSAPEWADACVQIAHTDPKFAAALDRVCANGPYAALITVALGTGLQLVRNHRPALTLPGTVHPDSLLASQKEMTDGTAPAPVPAAA